jgi:3-phosphoshikimate 1-carboxyvinyltransferase
MERVELGNGEPAQDIIATRTCLAALCAPQAGVAQCNALESGSTLRFLLPVAAALGRECVFFGEGRLPERPLEPLLSLLRGHGVTVEGERLPLRLHGQLQAGAYALPGNISSQYLSGLLFALPLLQGESEIRLITPLESAGYVAMTLQTLARFGVQIHIPEPGVYGIPGGQRCRTEEARLAPEGDWGGAVFWMAAAALAGKVDITGLDLQSAQPDAAALSLLERMGAVAEKHAGTLRIARAALRATELDASGCPDLVPIAAVLMALAAGESRIYNAARLRSKESDRLAAMAQNLNALGAQVRELPDALIIRGVEALRGGTAEGFNDHRIAMAMGVAALRADGAVRLRGSDCVRKSYPAFWADYARLRGEEKNEFFVW